MQKDRPYRLMIRIDVRVDPQVIASPACGCGADFLVMIATATARSKQRGAILGGVWECDGWPAGPARIRYLAQIAWGAESRGFDPSQQLSGDNRHSRY
jgi:hypothetical protein